jgi:hypothetical protein
MNQQPLEILRETYCTPPSAAIQPFVEYFQKTFGDELAAVVFYGSRLDDQLAGATSFFDFYLVCDDYERFFSRRRDRWLARALPPNIYYLELPGAAGPAPACKYCVISLADLQESVSERARDLYHLGRFSKRLAVVWARGERESDAVLDVCLQAMRTLAPHALNKMNERFSLRELILQVLALSYEGEVRLEKTAEKAQALFAAAEPFYRRLWPLLLAECAPARPELRLELPAADAPENYRQNRSLLIRAGADMTTAKLIARSRRRARARWPKNIVLVDNWLDILLAKVERTYGVKLDLTPTERRWVLILGWRHYFRLRREGKIR